MVKMTKTGGMQYRYRSQIKQQRPLSFVKGIFICLAILTPLSCQIDCVNREIQALLAFKNGLHDPAAGCLASWNNTSLSCFQWEGVSCDRQTGHVVAVDLHNCSLSGDFRPGLLLQLRDLKNLSVGTNFFTGHAIPRELGLLKNLAYLNLSTAGFAGNIPWQLGNLSKLTVLDLTWSALTPSASMLKSDDLSWLTNLTALKELYLDGIDLSATSSSWGQSVSFLSHLRNLTMSNCRLTGNIGPPSLQNLASLEILHLNGNKFNSEIPSWLGNMTSLVSLQMSSANLSGSLPFESLSRLPYLKRIYLGKNKISGDVSLIFQAKWKNLTLFQMPNNSLYGSISSSIGNLASLSTLDLRNNRLEGTIPESLGLLRSLTILDLGYNNITGPVPSEICTMLHISTYLSLASNKLEGQIPPCICEQTENLKVLDLSDNKLLGHLSSQFGNCSSLTVLNLANNSFQGRIPAELGNLKKLKVLHMNDNSLSGQIPSSLQNCKMLQILDLSRNGLSGKVPGWIASLSNLRMLVLRSDNLEGEIPIQIGYLQKLQIIDLAMNRLSGSIPRQFSELSIMKNEDFTKSSSTDFRYGPYYYKDIIYLMEKGHEWAYTKIDLWTNTYMDLSSNNLTGDIPDELGNLKGLRTLNLSHNHLGGNIPEEFTKMVELETLDLSCNELQGRIPATLAELTFLASLNLSNNNLTGRIPYGSQWDTFGVSSFSGNPELCGYPLQGNCESVGEGIDIEQPGRWWESWKVGMGLGWVIGFGIVVGTLALSNDFRAMYYQVVDSFFISVHHYTVTC